MLPKIIFINLHCSKKGTPYRRLIMKNIIPFLILLSTVDGFSRCASAGQEYELVIENLCDLENQVVRYNDSTRRKRSNGPFLIPVTQCPPPGQTILN